MGDELRPASEVTTEMQAIMDDSGGMTTGEELEVVDLIEARDKAVRLDELRPLVELLESSRGSMAQLIVSMGDVIRARIAELKGESDG